MRDKITQPLRLLIVLMMFVISLGLQAIQVQAVAAVPQVSYRTHVQNVGCQGYVKDGAMSGTSGRGLRLEGIRIRLTGEISKYYDVYYRTHVQSVGWQDWQVNGWKKTHQRARNV